MEVNKSNIKQIYQIDRTGKVKVFNSLVEAGKQTKVAFKGISAVCHGKQKTAGGFIWRFTDSDLFYTLDWLLNKQDRFINKAIALHKDKYDYNKVMYKGSHNNITIICKVHGEFNQTPSNHLKGRGCTKCHIAKTRMTTKQFIEKAEKAHKGKYDYSYVYYTRTEDKIDIICRVCGLRFQQIPNSHLAGNGCPACANIVTGNKLRSTTEEWKAKATTIHNGYYDYSQAIYTTGKNLITIVCPKHGELKQVAQEHLVGKGCQQCASYGFQDYLPAILYYLRIEHNNQTAYKIGITNRTVFQRYNAVDLAKITVLSKVHYNQGIIAREEERRILKEFKQYKWKGPNLLRSGNTELFDRDVLELDEKDIDE